MTKKLTAILIAIVVIVFGVAAITLAAPLQNQPEIVISEAPPEYEKPEEEVKVIYINTETEDICPPAYKELYAKCNVNVREFPLEEGNEPYTTLKRGECVRVMGESGGWSKIFLDNNYYYVCTEYLVDKETYDKISKVPYSEKVPLSYELQEYLWNECQDLGIDYCFALATINFESQFNPKAFNKKTIDRGLCQVNKCWVDDFQKLGWISYADDLFEPFTNIHCGMYILNDAVQQFGNTERAYAYYNTGNSKVHSNKNSRKVMEYWDIWKAELAGIINAIE